MTNNEDRHQYFAKMMVNHGVRSFGELLHMLHEPNRDDDAAAPLPWTFVITLEDLAGCDPLERIPADVLTWVARERMMREYALFTGVPDSEVEREIVALRSDEDRCETCGHFLYGGDAACRECGEAVQA